MIWVRDRYERLRRPYYELGELEELCERVLSGFSRELHGQLLMPVPTGR
ncbi:MAG: hypothetical protein ACREQ4_05555 [Candidatus Binataceae bacterium]